MYFTHVGHDHPFLRSVAQTTVIPGKTGQGVRM